MHYRKMLEVGKSDDTVIKSNNLIVADLYISENPGLDKHMVSFRYR